MADYKIKDNVQPYPGRIFRASKTDGKRKTLTGHVVLSKKNKIGPILFSMDEVELIK